MARRYAFREFVSTANLCALVVPLAWLFLFTPYGMDTTDFGYFYGYAWRILEGQTPYRDFAYIKPALPLYWHALWLWLTPEKYAILGGKAGFLVSILLSSWLCSLYLARYFCFKSLKLPLPLLATCGFIFGVHSFPHMPWHTADGILFSTLALWLSASHPFLSGLSAACAMACKQSFLPVPIVIVILLCANHSRRDAILFAAGLALALGSFCFWLLGTNAWDNFIKMTTGQLDWREALDAGLLIYLRQNWLLPLVALAPWLAGRIFSKKMADLWQPCILYMLLLCACYIWQVETGKSWIGFGFSWPTLFMCLGALAMLFSRAMLAPIYNWPQVPHAAWKAACSLGASLVAAWCVAISGGYKIPAMLAVPSLFSFFIAQKWLGGNVASLAWLTLFCGMSMFATGYQYPYVFPERPLARSEQVYDAGEIYQAATGVKVDADMLARLAELKALRQKYGPRYKTMPGFTMAYFLNKDQTVYGSDWLIDWEINGETERFYKDLLDSDLVVFMEKDQLDAKQADAYSRAAYTVPQLVRNNWRIIEETPHFVVFKAPTK